MTRAFIERDRITRLSQLLSRSNFSAREIQLAIARLGAAGKIVVRGDFALSQSEWEVLCKSAAAAVETFHREHPERKGFPIADLPAAIGAVPFATQLAEFVSHELTRSNFVRDGHLLKKKTHRPELPPRFREAVSVLGAILAARAIDAPSRKDIAPDAQRQDALRFLVQNGEVVELGHELVLSARHFEHAREAVRRHLQQHTSGTVSELRKALVASRRVVVPLLERLDRDGITRRAGDARILKNGN